MTHCVTPSVHLIDNARWCRQVSWKMCWVVTAVTEISRGTWKTWRTACLQCHVMHWLSITYRRGPGQCCTCLLLTSLIELPHVLKTFGDAKQDKF